MEIKKLSSCKYSHENENGLQTCLQIQTVLVVPFCLLLDSKMDPAEEGQFGALLFLNLVVLLFVILSLIYAARCYKKRRSWVNFFILRSLVGCLIGQLCNILSIQFNLWSHTITAKIVTALLAIGTFSQTMLSVYRFSIFKDVLPKWTASFLKLKRFGPSIGTLFLVHAIPLLSVLFVKLDGDHPQVVATYITSWMWYSFWQLVDFGLGIWSLILAVSIKQGLVAKQPLTRSQRKYFILCVASLVCLLISDIFFWPNMFESLETLFKQGAFDDQVAPQMRIMIPTFVMHIAVSFVYLHLSVKFIASSRNAKDVVPAAGSAGSSGSNKGGETVQPLTPVSKPVPKVDLGTGSSDADTRSKEL
jgi:hypothetical protein